MKLTFRLRYYTRPGQSLFLQGDHALFGAGNFEQAIPLRYRDADHWEVTVVVPREAALDANIPYHYVLREPDGHLCHDWGRDRVIKLAALPENTLVLDGWNSPAFFENTFYTEPFQELLLPRDTVSRSDPPPPPAKATHVFKAKAPLLEPNQTLCLLGSAAALGNWDTAQPVPMRRGAGDTCYAVALDLANESFPIEFKFGVFDVQHRQFVRYEDGPNRVLIDAPAPDQIVLVQPGFAVLPANTWRGAGVAIPVFSLRTAKSFGAGEFADLKLLADWAAKVGLRLIQILPVNDTTATHTRADSYPYAAISAFALHPLYLNLELLLGPAERAALEELEPERQRLNSLASLDYEAVMKAKLAFVREVFPSQRTATFSSEEFRAFFGQNKDWLLPYAVFCQLRDRNGNADFNQWPEHRTWQPDGLAAVLENPEQAPDDIALHLFIQFHLHRQLKEAAAYAHARGVILKGDIAIGVYRYSADTWQEPGLYHLDVQAGAPPDAFAAKGQNWGFPTYRWRVMQQDGFAWWKRRFAQMSNYFDAFRIDHILGFFRIWSIPLDAVEGILGYFVPALPVRAEEFGARGIAFDRQRFTRPFITDEALQETFGPRAKEVKNVFLDKDRCGHYALKPQFRTQRQVEQFFATQPASEHSQALKQGLFDLTSNVILFEEAGSEGQRFHFRFAIDQTASFKALDPATRQRLWDLYIDYFYRRQDDFWRQEALQKLPALKRETNMLICGEDLGMVPHCVPAVMRDLGLLSLEIQRMPKDPRQAFFRPKDAPYLAVVTPSTHDMSTIRGWWEEDPGLTQRFYNSELGRHGPAPKQCEPWVNEAIVRQHLESPAMWSIFQLQDLLGLDGSLRHPNPAGERINVPANPRHYWGYRVHLPLEQLLEANEFNRRVRALVEESGRGTGPSSSPARRNRPGLIELD